MATTDVSEKLHHLDTQLAVHERLHAQNTETLKEVKDVLISNAKISQQLTHVDKRLDSMDYRFDKIDNRVETNHYKIVYWSGGIAVIVLFSCIIFSAFELSLISESTPSDRNGSRVESPQHQQQQSSKTQ